MKLYRMIKRTPLSTGHRYGDLIVSDRLRPKVIEALVAKKVIALVQGPPLNELPGWTTRASRLRKRLAIYTVADFICHDTKVIANEYNYRISTVERWKEEAMQWLITSTKTQKKSG